jgi:hypothetical protein
MESDDKDAVGANDGDAGQGARADSVGEGSRAEPTPLAADEPAPYHLGWRERVLGWLFVFSFVFFVLWRLIPVLLAALFALVMQTLVYLALFGRRDRPARPEADEASTLLLDSYADLSYGDDGARGIGGAFAAGWGALSGGVAFCGAVALAHCLLTAPVLWDSLYSLWLLFVAFPLGATLGSVTGRAAWRGRRGEWAAARDIAERGGTGIAAGMAVAVPVAVVYALVVCGGDPDCVHWYLSAELPIYLLALLWGLALRGWSVPRH